MGKSKNLVSVHIYLTPAQKMQLEKIAITKRTPVSLLMRTIVETYLKYMDRAFMHPGENDVMQRIQKLEDRLVRLSIKGMHATGQILYLTSMLWKIGARPEGMEQGEYKAVMDKSKLYSLTWLDNRPKNTDNKDNNAS